LWVARADPNGPISDSRRGLGSYYRYNPRSIKKLTDDRFADVVIRRPKIHESVFRRIHAARDDYAPIVLPERYDIVTAQGDILDNGHNPYEHVTQASARCADQERVWNRVWVRRGLYFSTVAVTAVLLLAPALFEGDVLGELDARSGSITAVLSLIGAFVPEMLQPIVTFWQSHPVIFAWLAITLIGLLWLSTIVQRSIGYRMRSLWDGIVDGGAQSVGPATPPTDIVYILRSHPTYRSIVEFLSQRAFPFVFGLAALGAVVLIVVGTANRAVFTVMSAAGQTCRPAVALARTAAAWPEVKFSNKEICQSTGIELERGRTYEVSITLPTDWADKKTPASLAGFGSSENPWVYIPALPFRRVLREQWFVPIARIGRHIPEYHTLTQPMTEITPRRTGQLYLFVNDAVGIPPWHRFFYQNNKGGPAIVTVKERVADGQAMSVRP
jgi:hypothetical protein